MAVEHLHRCLAEHSETVPVHEVFRGKTVWDGGVEVYNLTGHPKAKQCFAWSYLDGPGSTAERFVAVLGIPLVDGPRRAVQASIAKTFKSTHPDGTLSR